MTDEVLSRAKINWEEMKSQISKWCENNKNHPKSSQMIMFCENFDRRNYDLKEVRNIIIALMESAKPWEVLVGQFIAENLDGAISKTSTDNSIFNYLGKKTVENLLQ